MSRAHHPRAAAWELYFTATARLTERIEAALKGQAGLSMPEYSVLLMTDRAGEEGIRPSVLAHRVVFSRSRLVFLTLDGKTLFDKAALIQRAVIRRLFLDDITPEEVSTLTSLFTRVSARLDDDSLC